MSYDFDRILDALTATVPEPYVPPPTPQKSWAGLKPGQRLRSRVDAGPYRAGTLFVVLETDSAGMTLAPQLRWTQRDWQNTFDKQRASRRMKARKDAK